VSDIDYPKFSARDQGVTYPKVGSSFLFQLQGGQTHEGKLVFHHDGRGHGKWKVVSGKTKNLFHNTK